MTVSSVFASIVSTVTAIYTDIVTFETQYTSLFLVIVGFVVGQGVAFFFHL